MIRNYVSLSMSVDEAVRIMGIARSTYYLKVKGTKKGKRPSLFTVKADGLPADDSAVISAIKEHIKPEFHDYGYKMVTVCLKEEGYVINKKKVYRLMKEKNLLHPKIKNTQGNKQYVEFTVPLLERPFATVETDIKYIYIHGERKNAFLISFLCTFSRYVATWDLSYTMKANQVAYLIEEFIHDPVVEYFTKDRALQFKIRSDNGPQFVARLIAEQLKKHGLEHEFIHPATPQENGHIESFHNTVERLVCRRYEFSDIEHARSIFREFFEAYNRTRKMEALCYYPPLTFLKLWDQGYIEIREKNKKQIFFLREKPTNTLLAGLSPEELFCHNKDNALDNKMSNNYEMSPVL